MDLQQRINNALDHKAHIERVEWPPIREQLQTVKQGSPEHQELRKKAIGLWWGYQTALSCLRVLRRAEGDQEIENFLKEIGGE